MSVFDGIKAFFKIVQIIQSAEKTTLAVEELRERIIKLEATVQAEVNASKEVHALLAKFIESRIH